MNRTDKILEIAHDLGRRWREHRAAHLDNVDGRIPTKLIAIVDDLSSWTSVDARIAKPDLIRADKGDYVRASGLAVCDACGCAYWEHATVVGLPWLHRACDGRLLKL